MINEFEKTMPFASGNANFDVNIDLNTIGSNLMGDFAFNLTLSDLSAFLKSLCHPGYFTGCNNFRRSEIKFCLSDKYG